MKPKIVISKCLGFGNCRYNGEILTIPFVDELKERAECIPVCPEMEIGLGVPRDPILIVLEDGTQRLIQPVTNRDLTDAMQNFCHQFLDFLNEVDGFILKCRSPSCGIGDVDIFADRKGETWLNYGNGFFANAVFEQFKGLPVENEERLEDVESREKFYSTLRLIKG